MADCIFGISLWAVVPVDPADARTKYAQEKGDLSQRYTSLRGAYLKFGLEPPPLDIPHPLDFLFEVPTFRALRGTSVWWDWMAALEDSGEL